MGAMKKAWFLTMAVAAVVLAPGPVVAQTFNSGSTGADGAFNRRLRRPAVLGGPGNG